VAAPEVNRQVEQWLPILQRSRPFFLWVHYVDPHAPYRRHEPWFSEFFPDATPEQRRLDRLVSKHWSVVEDLRGERDRDYVVALYDSDIRFLDEQLAVLFEKVGIDDGDLVIVTADHGEEFLEHGLIGHGRKLYEESVRVPFLLKLPQNERAGTRVELPVSIIDVFPTIADVLGLAGASRQFQGRSVLKLDEKAQARPIYASTTRFESWKSRALVVGDWKFIHNLKGGPSSELFNLAADPAERNDLAATEPERVARMRVELDRLAQLGRDAGSHRQPESVQLSEEERERLRQLGYGD